MQLHTLTNDELEQRVYQQPDDAQALREAARRWMNSQGSDRLPINAFDTRTAAPYARR